MTLIRAVEPNESDELIGHSALEFGRAGALAHLLSVMEARPPDERRVAVRE
jgi:hypothetical protein